MICYVMSCYITQNILCYITHHMLCYITHHNAMLYNTCYVI